MSEMNDQLLGFCERWYLDGDYLRCRACDRPQIASRANEPFVHADGCKNGLGAERKPWIDLHRIIAPLAARNTRPAPSEDEVLAAAKRIFAAHLGIGWSELEFHWLSAPQVARENYLRMARAALGVANG